MSKNILSLEAKTTANKTKVWGQLTNPLKKKLRAEMIKQEVYRNWYSEYHGLELKPNVNTPSARITTENGILYFTEFLMLLDIREDLQTLDRARFYNLCRALQVTPGLYDRGAGESNFIPYDQRRSISQDNIVAVASGSVICDYDFQNEIAYYGLEHGFMFNNIAPRLVLPMNPGNYSPWLAMAGKKFLPVVFFIFYLINILITSFKNKQNTSSKKLYIIELYALVIKQNNRLFKFVSKLFFSRLVSQYGEDFIHQIYKIYYPEDHPLVFFSKNIVYKRGSFTLEEN